MTGLTELQFKETNKQLAQAGGHGNFPLVSEGIFCEQLTASSGTAPALDFTKSLNWFVDMTDNCTVTVTNPTQPCVVRVKFQQAAAGSKTLTLPATFLGSLTITATADKYDVTWWEFDGTNYYLKGQCQAVDS